MTALLCFDTATHATVVGLRLAGGETLQARDDPPSDAHPGHATRLLTMAAGLLDERGVRWSEVSRIAVGVGPGRFTGLRVGIATARGLARSLSAELVGVSTLRALALGAAERSGAAAAGRGTIAVIDARRGEAFAAAYAPDGAEVELAHALASPELAELVAEIERRGGRSGLEWQAVGDGALRFADELSAAGANVPAPDSPLHLLDAAALGELGARGEPAQSPEAVLPDYRREPDAALVRSRSGATRGALTPGAAR